MTTAFIHFHPNRIAWKVEGDMPSGDEVEPLPMYYRIDPPQRLLTIEESREVALAAVIKKIVPPYKPDTIHLTYGEEVFSRDEH